MAAVTMIDARRPEPGETYTALSGHVYLATDGKPLHRASCPCWATGGHLSPTRTAYLRHFTGADLRPAPQNHTAAATTVRRRLRLGGGRRG